MILEVITCEKPQCRHVFVGVKKEDWCYSKNNTWTIRLNIDGTIERTFVNPIYFTWYEEFALPKLNFNNVHCQNIFYK